MWGRAKSLNGHNPHPTEAVLTYSNHKNTERNIYIFLSETEQRLTPDPLHSIISSPEFIYEDEAEKTSKGKLKLIFFYYSIMKTQTIKHAKEPEMRLGRRERQNEVARVRL